jgi:hypothetical protein
VKSGAICALADRSQDTMGPLVFGVFAKSSKAVPCTSSSRSIQIIRSLEYCPRVNKDLAVST